MRQPSERAPTPGGTDRGLSTVRTVLVALLVLGGSVGGAFALGVVGAPSVVGVENRFGEVTNETTTIDSALTVNNPNPIGVSLGGVTIDYDISMNDVSMANGTKEGVSVGTGNTSVPFTTELDNSKIPAWWVSHVRNGEHTDLQVDAAATSSLAGQRYSTQVSRDVNTSVIEAFRTDESKPLNASSPVVSDPVLILERTEAEWGTVNEERTEVEMTLHLRNPKPYPIPVSEIGYDIHMNNITMGSGEAARTTTIAPGETVAVEATTVIRTGKLDEWWVSHLRQNQVTDLRMPFYLVIDLSNGGGGEQRIELDSYERTIETDIFGTKPADGSTDAEANGSNDNSESNDDTATGTPTGTGTSDEHADGGSTDTATASSTPTATPTATPTSTPEGTSTDDDGLF